MWVGSGNKKVSLLAQQHCLAVFYVQPHKETDVSFKVLSLIRPLWPQTAVNQGLGQHAFISHQ